MADPKVVREWLAKADEDFNFAKTNLEEEHEFYSQSASTSGRHQKSTLSPSLLHMISNSRNRTTLLRC
jgi:hypothetical protein